MVVFYPRNFIEISTRVTIQVAAFFFDFLMDKLDLTQNAR